MQPSALGTSIRVQLSLAVDLEALCALHAEPVLEQAPEPLRELLESAKISRLKEVHPMSRTEIESDKYGFAREFVFYVTEPSDLDGAIDLLKRSPLVVNARPEGVRRIW